MVVSKGYSNFFTTLLDLIFKAIGMIPYSQRNRSKNFSECLVFYEHNINFADIVRKPEDFVDDVLRFPAVVTPDNSLYRDAPLIVQMLNVYRNRAIGHFLQKNGAYVITNVRWGDERSYSTEFLLENGKKVILPEKFAFLGAPKTLSYLLAHTVAYKVKKINIISAKVWKPCSMN